MTRVEEIVQYLKNELAGNDPEIYLDIDDYKIIVEALEQEPCEDCVSRQAVLDLMQIKMGGKELYKAVYELPPVNPQEPKIGHWRKTPKTVMGEGYMWYCKMSVMDVLKIMWKTNKFLVDENECQKRFYEKQIKELKEKSNGRKG